MFTSCHVPSLQSLLTISIRGHLQFFKERISRTKKTLFELHLPLVVGQNMLLSHTQGHALFPLAQGLTGCFATVGGPPFFYP